MPTFQHLHMRRFALREHRHRQAAFYWSNLPARLELL
jgi:hypothetical protein